MRIVLIGGGGHARVVAEAARRAGLELTGYTDPAGPQALPIPWLGDDSFVLRFLPVETLLVNGLGSVGDSTGRREAVKNLEARGYRFATIRDLTSSVAADVEVGDGTVILMGALIQPGVRIGRHCILNTGAVVDHDCVLGDYVHIAPSATLCGGVSVGDAVHVGAGATVIQGRRLGAGSVIGAGAVVAGDIPASVTVVGVPARVLDRGR